MKTIERSGDPVFANVDEALAERIISRSRENCAGSGPIGEGVADPNFNGVNDRRDCRNVRQYESFPLLKIAAAAVALLVLMILIFGRGGKKG